MGNDEDRDVPDTLAELQREVSLWCEQQWPHRLDFKNLHFPFYRLVSLVGEMADRVFDSDTDETVDVDTVEEYLKAALGEGMIILLDFAARCGWSLERIVAEHWERRRGGEDWKRRPSVGRRPKGGLPRCPYCGNQRREEE